MLLVCLMAYIGLLLGYTPLNIHEIWFDVVGVFDGLHWFTTRVHTT